MRVAGAGTGMSNRECRISVGYGRVRVNPANADAVRSQWAPPNTQEHTGEGERIKNHVRVREDP